MFLRDGVDFNIPFLNIFFFVIVHLDEGHLLLLYLVISSATVEI